MEKINEVLEKLPEAEEKQLFLSDGSLVEERKGIFDAKTGNLHDVVSDGYVLIQHKDAFKRMIDSLEVPDDADLNVTTGHYKGRAEMNLLFNKIVVPDDSQGVTLGLKLVNSYDRSSAFGVQLKRNIYEKGKFIVFYGMRQICSNGMKIMIPLSQMTAEEIDKMSPNDVRAKEENIKVHTEAFTGRIVHYGKNTFNLKFMNLQDMVNRASNFVKIAIQNAINKNLTETQLKLTLQELNLPNKIIEEMIEEFKTEKKSTWDAYNQVTAYASHKVSNLYRRDELLEGAWNKFML